MIPAKCLFDMTTVMKRTIILIAILATFPWMQALAETQDGFTLATRLSIASVPENVFYEFNPDNFNYNEPLASIYGDYACKVGTCGNITGSLDMIFSGRCALSVDLGVTILWKEMYDGITRKPGGYSKTGAALHLLPQFRFFYLKRPLIRLYGNIGLGMTTYFGEDFRNRIDVAGQFSPFGIELGRKFFGFAEFGIGTTYSGIRGGIGYKF